MYKRPKSCSASHNSILEGFFRHNETTKPLCSEIQLYSMRPDLTPILKGALLCALVSKVQLGAALGPAVNSEQTAHDFRLVTC